MVEGDSEFFALTKRIHNGLYGVPRDGGPLGDAERCEYERVLRRNAQELLALVKPRDIVLIHDPQPASDQQLEPKGPLLVGRSVLHTDLRMRLDQDIASP